jgi:hypothetical protein
MEKPFQEVVRLIDSSLYREAKSTVWRIKWSGEYIVTPSSHKTVWSSIGAAKNAIWAFIDLYPLSKKYQLNRKDFQKYTMDKLIKDGLLEFIEI